MTVAAPKIEDRNYTEVVLTGGPCAGKATAISHIVSHFSERGIRVLCVPEVATILINGGLSDLPSIGQSNPGAHASIEAEMMAMQGSLRRHYRSIAEALAPQECLILYDRAECDIRAYVDDEVFFALLRERGLSLQDVRDSYDLVCHLVTAADGAEERYTLENNPARFETPEQARASDKATLRGWLGHPHLRVIDNSTNFEGKLARLLGHVNGVLGGDEHVEYERRYLLASPPDLSVEPLADAQPISIKQTYLLSDDPEDEVRVRRWAQGEQASYFWTQKRRLPSGGREEREALIRSTEYLHLLSTADPGRHPIEKTRYCFIWSGQHCELDAISLPGRAEPLWILEVELVDEAVPFTPPSMFEIEAEVTDDPSFSNSALAALR